MKWANVMAPVKRLILFINAVAATTRFITLYLCMLAVALTV